MIRRTVVVVVATTALIVSLIGPAAAKPPQPGPIFPIVDQRPSDSDNVVLKWNEALLASIRLARPPVRAFPTINARALAILNTAIYDAWAAYDPTAKATQPNASGLPAQPPSDAAKAEAISHAAFTVLTTLPPYNGLADQARAMLSQLGYAADSTSTNAEIGRGAANAVLNARRDDGANQASNYDSTVSYTARGSYADAGSALLWQPLPGQTAQVPHWRNVGTFGLPGSWRTDSRYAAPGPAFNNGNIYRSEAQRMVAQSKSLTDAMKACAVYWADGISSETPPGHWNVIAQAVSRRDANTLDEDVRMFFALGHALHNAGVVSWDAKYRHDFARPATLIRWYFYYGEKPDKRDPAMQNWNSYITTPPFPEYTSGHSTFSAAAAQVLRSATGSDSMNLATVVPAGAGTQFLSPGKTPPATSQTIRWSTFSQAVSGAGGSGISRVYGGIHFDDGNRHGQNAGTNAGRAAWDEAQRYLRGQAGF